MGRHSPRLRDGHTPPCRWAGRDLKEPAAVNVGNPHVIFFVDDSYEIELDRLGPMIEIDPLFPERVNVNVAHVAEEVLHLRVWERGVGLTPRLWHWSLCDSCGGDPPWASFQSSFRASSRAAI